MRICTWNIQYGRRLPDVLRAVETVEDFAGVDMLALQEASAHEGRCDAEQIAAALGPEYMHVQATAQRRRGHEQANALVWRASTLGPAAASVVLPLPGKDTVTMRRAERTLLRATPPQSRIALCVELEGLRVYVVHLDVIGFAHKLAQFQCVLDDLKARPAAPLTLVAGDLNTFGPSRPKLWRRLGRAAESAGLTNLTAHIRRTHWTGQKLDAIYALADDAPVQHRAWTARLRASDHLPVFVELAQ